MSSHAQEESGIWSRAQELLHAALNPEATFRAGQWEAIRLLVVDRQRVLVVQRTGWGKSLVYFLATRLLRDQGTGPTLLLSPLLSLMRNQIAMADRMGVRAETINSANQDAWEGIERSIRAGACDLLLISPERLANPRFRTLLTEISGQIGLFVVDEAHCISDWGHDFRPDYRRIVRVIQNLPEGVPVLGTTATANDRVIDDVRTQLGPSLQVLRGPLARSSLRLQNIRLADQSERLAWLAENLNKFPGTGVIYCLTVADTERVANWLKSRGHAVEAYHAGSEAEIDREALEQSLLNNDLKALVATVALGMGFDKPDLGFVIHFQRPGSVIAYYQQVGRGGRSLDRAYGILLNGREDDEIQDYFITSAFPPADLMKQILRALEGSEGLSIPELLTHVNISASMAEKALKLLETDGAVGLDVESRPRRFFRTLNPWQPDLERMDRVTEQRRAELAQMRAYVDYEGCLMEFLTRALDDPTARACGRCANCRGRGLSSNVSTALVADVVSFLRRDVIVISPRNRWPIGLFPGRVSTIPEAERIERGRALCYYLDAGWGRTVRDGKYQHGFFADELVTAAAELIISHWRPQPAPAWVTAIPSNRHPSLVPEFAARLASTLGLPFHQALNRIGNAPEQKLMANSSMQARNVCSTLAIAPSLISKEPVLLVDDIVDSRWTLTMAGWLLQTHGSGPVHPFVLARATARNT